MMPLDKVWVIWSDCLRGEDENSIFQQIFIMIWDATIFRFILESRYSQIKKNPENPLLNASFHSFLDRNFFQSQAAFIRRIADKSKYGLFGNKGIYSLYSLIDDINNRRDELTREVFFNLRQIPYDYSGLRQGARNLMQQIKKERNGFFIPPEFDWEISAEVHRTFDRLCGVQPHKRQPQDIIEEKVFLRLKEKLDTCCEVNAYVDKYVAHSATPASREVDNVDSTRITLKHIWDAHQTIYEIAEFLSGVLFSEGHAPLAWKSPIFFENWDAPLVESQDIARLEDVYKQFEEETNRWQLEGIEALWKWIESHKS